MRNYSGVEYRYTLAVALSLLCSLSLSLLLPKISKNRFLGLQSQFYFPLSHSISLQKTVSHSAKTARISTLLPSFRRSNRAGGASPALLHSKVENRKQLPPTPQNNPFSPYPPPSPRKRRKPDLPSGATWLKSALQCP